MKLQEQIFLRSPVSTTLLTALRSIKRFLWKGNESTKQKIVKTAKIKLLICSIFSAFAASFLLLIRDNSSDALNKQLTSMSLSKNLRFILYLFPVASVKSLHLRTTLHLRINQHLLPRKVPHSRYAYWLLLCLCWDRDSQKLVPRPTLYVQCLEGKVGPFCKNELSIFVSTVLTTA